jgi:hypothetical protein
MRLVLGPTEFEVSADQSIREIKVRFPLYLYAKKKQWVTSAAIMGGTSSISRQDLQAELASLNLAITLSASTYTFDDVLSLNLDGEYEKWVALGQSLPPHVSANPRFYHETGGRAEPDLDRLLLDYLPLVDDAIYGSAPTQSVYLTAADAGPTHRALPPLKAHLQLVKTVKFALPSKCNHPVLLARAFQTLHATDQVPVLRLNAAEPLYRVHERVEFQTVLPPKDGTLTAVWRNGLLCNFFEDGRVEITYTPSEPRTLERCNHRLQTRLNPFISLLNRTLEMGTPFESDLRALSGNLNWLVDGAYPFFKEIEHVINMKMVLEMDPVPLMYCKVSSNNVATKINSCVGPNASLHLLRLGLTPEEAGLVLSGVPAKPLQMRFEGNKVLLDNIDNLHYLSFLNNSEEERVAPAAPVDLDPLVLVGLVDPCALPESIEEVHDFLVVPQEEYDLIRLPAAAYAGELPAGIQSFLQTSVLEGPRQSFSQCMSRVLGTDFRLLLECSLDSKLFETYGARRAFSSEPMHPLRQGTPRDNFIRHLRTDPDHTHLWDMVCRPGLFDGYNLLLFHGECKKDTELLHRRDCPFDPTRRTIVLWKRGDQYSLIRTSGSTTFAFHDFEFLKKVAEIRSVPKKIPSSADALGHVLQKGNYDVQRRVEHRGKVVGIVASCGDKRCMIPCFGEEHRLQLPTAAFSVQSVAEPLSETIAFLEAAARDLKIACRPRFWVQGAFGACVGLLTESHHFVPCKTGSCALPAITVQELKYGRGEATYMAARELLRTRKDLSALDQLVEWVDNLPPELLTYPRYVNRKLIVLKSQRHLFVRRLTDDLERYVHVRCFLLNQMVYVKGRGHDVFETEHLYAGTN